MSEFKLTTEGIRYIALFESLTGGVARDCIIDDDNDRIIFVSRRETWVLPSGGRAATSTG